MGVSAGGGVGVPAGGAGVGVAVGVGVIVGVAVGVGVIAGVAVGVGVLTGVAVGDGVGDGSEGVGVNSGGVAGGAGVDVAVAVGVAVTAGVAVAVGVVVAVMVAVGVMVAVTVGVMAGVGVNGRLEITIIATLLFSLGSKRSETTKTVLIREAVSCCTDALIMTVALASFGRSPKAHVTSPSDASQIVSGAAWMESKSSSGGRGSFITTCVAREDPALTMVTV